MELLLLVVLSGAISWGLSALVLLGILHALTHLATTRMGVALSPERRSAQGSRTRIARV